MASDHPRPGEVPLRWELLQCSLYGPKNLSVRWYQPPSVLYWQTCRSTVLNHLLWDSWPRKFTYSAYSCALTKPRILHANVSDDGMVCLGILEKSGWSPAITFHSLALALFSFLKDEPCIESPMSKCRMSIWSDYWAFVDDELLGLYIYSPSKYFKHVRYHTAQALARTAPYSALPVSPLTRSKCAEKKACPSHGAPDDTMQGVLRYSPLRYSPPLTRSKCRAVSGCKSHGARLPFEAPSLSQALEKNETSYEPPLTRARARALHHICWSSCFYERAWRLL